MVNIALAVLASGVIPVLFLGAINYLAMYSMPAHARSHRFQISRLDPI
jgi:hypothetical protein